MKHPTWCKNRIYMVEKKVKTGRLSLLCALSLLSLCCTPWAAAQDDDGNPFRDINRVKEREVRLQWVNPALLHHLPEKKISMAEVSTTVEQGALRDYDEAEKSLTAAIKSEAYDRLQPQLVVHGLVHYHRFEGINMGGSAFIDPHHAPFNIQEYSDTTRGTKVLEQYRLAGTISYSPRERWTLGAKLDYTAANYAKHKDLRHRNKLLDMTTAAGITYTPLPSWEVGAAYTYRKRVEGLYFGIYGTTDRHHVSLIDFGSFYGRTQGFSENGDGYTSGSTERPLVDNYHGAEIHSSYRITPSLLLLGNLFFNQRKGYYGIQSSSSVVYSRHTGNTRGFEAAFTLQKGAQEHLLQLRMEEDRLANYENVYNIINVEGGTSRVEYYGENKMLDHLHRKGRMNYTLYLGRAHSPEGGELPAYELGMTVEGHQRQRTTSIYPYYRKQDLLYGSLELRARRNMIAGRRLLAVTTHLSYTDGSGTPFTDGTYATPNEASTVPKSTLFLLEKEYGYLTDASAVLALSLRYAVKWREALLPYAEISFSHRQALQGEAGTARNRMEVAVGCLF